MRYWYDCEFLEDGHTIDLISIGIVAEDGREYYTQSCEFSPTKASDWVKKNVLPHLQICPYTICQEYNSGDFAFDYVGGAIRRHKQGQCTDQLYGKRHRCPWRTREQIKQNILSFMDVERHGKPELWGYYSAYDHVAFCQLFGTMIDLPKGFPMYTRDIKQWVDALGYPNLPEMGRDEHNALLDARWNKKAWELLEALEANRQR